MVSGRIFPWLVEKDFHFLIKIQKNFLKFVNIALKKFFLAGIFIALYINTNFGDKERNGIKRYKRRW